MDTLTSIRACGAELLSRLLLALFCAIALPIVFGAGVTHAQSKPIELKVTEAPLVIDSQVRAWVDTTGKAGVNDVHAMEESAFGPLPKRGDAPKGHAQALWLRVDVRASQSEFAWYLAGRQVSIDQVSLFTQDQSGNWVGQHAGTAVPVADWPIPDMRPIFAFASPVGVTQRLYVRAHDPYGSWTGLQVMSTKPFLQNRQFERLILGLYVGATLVVVGIGLASWLTWREPIWLAYSAYNLFMTVGQLAVIGLLGVTVFDQAPGMHEISVFTLIDVAAILCVGFTVHATQAFKRAPVFAWASVIYAGVAALAIATFAALRINYVPGQALDRGEIAQLDVASQMAFFMPILGAIGAVFLVAMMIRSWRSGYALSGAMLLAMSPVIVGSIPQIAYSLNLIPRSDLTEYAFVVGLVVESIAMLYVLQRHSRELAATQSRLREVGRIDALTGLVPRAAAVVQLGELIRQANDRGQPCAVMMVQFDNLDALVREHGPDVRDNVLLLAARQVGSQAESGDLAARIGQTRFLVAYSRLLHEEGLRQFAAGVIASGLREHPLIPLGSKLDYRIWIAMHQAVSGSAATLIDNLERHADHPATGASSRRIYRI